MRLCTLYRNTTQLIALTTMTVSLAACGFQLRSAAPVSSALEPLALECQHPVPAALCLAVSEQLELGGVQIASEEIANYQLRIRDFQQDRRASAITADASAAEYTLRHSVNIELVSADGIPIVTSGALTATESYRYDETSVLAKQREEESLQQQLSDRLAQQIIFRLRPMTQERLQEIRDQHQQTSTPANVPPARP